MGLSHVIKIALDNRIDRYFIGLDALEDCFYGLFVCLFQARQQHIFGSYGWRGRCLSALTTWTRKWCRGRLAHPNIGSSLTLTADDKSPQESWPESMLPLSLSRAWGSAQCAL